MKKKNTYKHTLNGVTRTLFVAALALLAVSCAHTTDALGTKVPTNEKKLKIVFMMGQSNMVGYSRPGTAWYLTQPAYIPPSEVGEKTSKYFNWDHYWSGVRYAYGDSEAYNAKGEALLAERKAIQKLWRARVYGSETGYKNDWKGWKKEWSPLPGDNESP